MNLHVDAGGVAAMSMVAAGRITDLGETTTHLQNALASGDAALSNAPRVLSEWDANVTPWVNAALALAQEADDIVAAIQHGVTALITADEALTYVIPVSGVTIIPDAS